MLFFDPIRRALERMRRDNLMRRFGGIQQCPWCRQIAQGAGDWRFKPYEIDQRLDVLTCGICDGTSLWLFAMGMHYQSPLYPPSPLGAAEKMKNHPLFQQGYLAGFHDCKLEAESEDV